MKKLENFTNSLSILAEADFKLAEENDIYRTGIIGQFNLTFELAWKALHAPASTGCQYFVKIIGHFNIRHLV